MSVDSIFQIVRRVHALEHATIHILSHRHPGLSFAGRSSSSGFTIVGKASTEEIQSAASSALQRLRNGEESLAYHPNCGTNIVVSGLMAGTAAFLTTVSFRETSWRKRLEQLPTVVSVSILALLAAQPVASLAQKNLTTNADPGTLSILLVENLSFGSVPAHRVHIHAR